MRTIVQLNAQITLNKWLKRGLIAGTIGVIGYAVTQGAKKLGGVTYSITGFGLPTLSGTSLTVPVIIHFGNPAPLAVTIDRILINLAYLQGSSYVYAGKLDQANFTVAPGNSNVTVYPQLDIKALFGNIISTLTTALINKALKIKADVTITIKGISASSTLTKDITI